LFTNLLDFQINQTCITLVLMATLIILNRLLERARYHFKSHMLWWWAKGGIIFNRYHWR